MQNLYKADSKSLNNRIYRLAFSEIYHAAKAPPGFSGIFFISSRHVEVIIMMTYCGQNGK